MAIFAYCLKCNRPVEAAWIPNNGVIPEGWDADYEDKCNGIMGGPCQYCNHKAMEKSNIVIIDGNLIDLSAITSISEIYEDGDLMEDDEDDDDEDDAYAGPYNFCIHLIGPSKITITRSFHFKSKVEIMRERLIARWNPSMLKFEDLTEK